MSPKHKSTVHDIKPYSFMKRFVGKLMVVFGGLLASSIAFASEGAGAAGVGGLIAIGAGLAIGLSVIGGTLGQGKAAASALEGIARNPTSSDKVFMPMIIALALIDFQAIMGFITAISLFTKV